MKKARMTGIFAIVLAGGACLSPNAHAAAWVVGYAATTCGSWTTQRRERPVAAAALQAWIAGFLSGVATASKPYLLTGIDADAIGIWIDDYCAVHPLAALSEAAKAMEGELDSRAAARRN